MKQHLGNHIGMVINSTDPEYRGRVQVFVPHIMPAIYEGWNEEGQDIEISCVGSNIPEGLTPEIHARLVKILPWAEAASPIIGSSAPGNLFSDIVSGVKSAAGAAYDAVAGAVNHTFNQGPTSEPVPVEGGDAGDLINKARGITGLAMNDAAKWGMCARGTTGLDKAAGLIDNTGPSSGFGQAADLTTSGTYNPYTTGEGAKNFSPPFKVDPNTYKPQVGDSVYAGGGSVGKKGQFLGHAQKCIGFKPDGTAIWHSDKAQSHFFTQNKTSPYTDFTVYRLNDQGLAKYTAAIGGKVTGQAPPSSSSSGHTADAASAAPNNLARSDGKTETAPVPQTNLVANPEAGMTGTISGGGTVSNPQLAQQRQKFLADLSNPATKARFYSIVESEVGGQGPETQKMFIESVMNRSIARNQSIDGGLNFYAPETKNKVSSTPSSTLSNKYDSLVNNVITTGSNTSNYATGNSSGTVGFGWGTGTKQSDGTVTAPGQTASSSGERFGIEKQDSKWAASLGADVNSYVSNPVAGTKSGSSSGGAPRQTTTTNVVNNTDSNGRTPVINTNDMASGLFAYPNPGAMVWVFFREGNPLFPVYFAASYSSAEWKSAYRGGNPAEAYTNEGGIIGTGTIMKLGPEGGFLSQNRTNLTDPLDNNSSLSFFHQHGSNITMKDGCDFYFSRNNKRDEVDNDRFIITKGYKEEWIEGDASTNTRGNLIVKVGNISAEAIAAMQELSNMSYEMNQMLMDKPKGGSGGSGGAKNAAETNSTPAKTSANAPVNSKAPVSDAFSPQRQPFGGSGTTTAQFKDSIKAAPVQTVPGASVASSQQAPKAVDETIRQRVDSMRQAK